MEKVVNYLKKDELTDAYILDGLTRKKANRCASRDCRKNPYEKELRKREEKALNDIGIIYGTQLTKGEKMKTKFIEAFEKFKRKHYNFFGVLSVVGIGLIGVVLSFAIYAFFVVIRALIIGLLLHLCYNNILVNNFGYAALTQTQIIVLSVLCAIISTFFGSRSRSKKRSKKNYY